MGTLFSRYSSTPITYSRRGAPSYRFQYKLSTCFEGTEFRPFLQTKILIESLSASFSFASLQSRYSWWQMARLWTEIVAEKRAIRDEKLAKSYDSDEPSDPRIFAANNAEDLIKLLKAREITSEAITRAYIAR